MKNIYTYLTAFCGIFLFYDAFSQEETNYLRYDDPQGKSRQGNNVIYREDGSQPENVTIYKLPRQENSTEDNNTPDSRTSTTSTNRSNSKPSQSSTTNTNQEKKTSTGASSAQSNTSQSSADSDESVLSYNFLYMLIKNFKIEEVLE